MRCAAAPRHEALLLASAEDRSDGERGGLCRQTRGARTLVLLGTDSSGKTTAATAERATRWAAVVLRNLSDRRWLLRISHHLEIYLPDRWAGRVETVVRTGNVLAAHARTQPGACGGFWTGTWHASAPVAHPAPAALARSAANRLVGLDRLQKAGTITEGVPI